MALTNNKTITSVLTSAASYASTIAGQTQRIADAHEIIQAKAIALGLKIQAGEGDSNINGESALTLADNHKIMDTASAINSIVLLNLGNKTPEHGASVTIPVGYVSSSYTVTSKGTHTSGKSDITAETVLTGKEGWTANGTKVAGTMPVQNAKSLSSANGGLTTNAQNATATITISRYKSVDGGTGLVARSVTIPAGYYETSITLTPKIVDNAGNEESILNYKDLSISGNLTFDANNNKIFYPLNSNLDYYGNITLPKVAGTTNTDGTYTVTTAGWINTGTYGTAYGGYENNSSHTLTSRTDEKFGTSKTIDESEITTLTSLYYTDVTSRGHTNGDTKYLKVQDASGSLSANISGTKTYTPSIEINTAGNVTIAKGSNNTLLTATTTKPTEGFYVAVKSSSNTGTITATASSSISRPGWISESTSNTTTATVGASESAVTYIPITVGSTSLGNLILQGSTALMSGNTTLVPANTYYIKCTTTEGYQKASDKYINIAKSTVSISGITYDASNGKFIASVKATAGYTPAITTNPITEFSIVKGSAFTVTRDGYNIAANTYFNSSTKVSVSAVAGILRDSTTETNSNISTADSNAKTVTTTKLDALTGDTTFYATGDGDFKRYFTSFRVEVADVIAALKAI